METIGERLKRLRENKQLSQDEVANYLGIDRTSYLKYEKDINKPTRRLPKLSDLFNVSADYILCQTDLPLTNQVPLPTDNKRVPIIGTVRCGPDGLAYEYLDGFVMVDADISGDIRAFHCKGDSMIGLGIFDGDIAIVRIQNEIENGEIAVVVINGDEGTLKRVRKHDGMIVLEAANPSYPPRIFNGEEANNIHIVGKVLETRRKY